MDISWTWKCHTKEILREKVFFIGKVNYYYFILFNKSFTVTSDLILLLVIVSLLPFFFSFCCLSLILIILRKNKFLSKPVCIGTLLHCSCSNFQNCCLTQECLTWKAHWRLMQCWFQLGENILIRCKLKIHCSA